MTGKDARRAAAGRKGKRASPWSTERAVAERPRDTSERVVPRGSLDTNPRFCRGCGTVDTVVVDTRKQLTRPTRRRIKCSRCGHRWSTVELHENDVAALEQAAVDRALGALEAELRRLRQGGRGPG